MTLRIDGITLLDAILKNCGGIYRIRALGPLTIVKGQALTYLQQSLRMKGWTRVTYSNLAHVAQENAGVLGFGRGRGRRIYHGGNMGWGGEADVFYRVASASQCTDEQLKREDEDEVRAGYF